MTRIPKTLLLQKLIRKTCAAAMMAGTFGLFGLPWTLMSDFGRPWAGQRWLDARSATCAVPPADTGPAQPATTAGRPLVANAWWV
ncbi:hypothetical protein [Nevskia sp.]|uniref:hypothetical protein n=1 Tax=Nevskia sp. TaxID=1929292 RepID=UPI0025E21077|nr:hypothetical protein [Nevskia sp.]